MPELWQSECSAKIAIPLFNMNGIERRNLNRGQMKVKCNKGHATGCYKLQAGTLDGCYALMRSL